MKDFQSYTGKGKTEGQEKSAPWMQEAQKLMSRYNGRNEGELIAEIFARAKESRKAGTLSDEEIDAFYAQLSPMLDGAKQRKLKKLVEEIKRI